MGNQPHIHFIEATTLEECETRVNNWIDTLNFLCSVINITVMPMMMNGKLTYVTVVTFTPNPSYMPAGGGPG